MATVTFQTIICDNPCGLVRLYFLTETDPFWQRLSKNFNATGPTSLDNIIKTFGVSAKVTLSVTDRSGTSNADAFISSTGSLNLLFTVNNSTFTVNCNVV